MNNTENLVKKLTESMQRTATPKTEPYDVQGTVRRVADGVAWVHIPGGVDETPVDLTINASHGDVVQVRVANGKAFLVGNASNPPTDDSTAKQALNFAETAGKAAASAVNSAVEAAEAAADAQQTAESVRGIAEQAQADATAAGSAASAAQTSASAAQASANAAGEAASRAQAAADAAQGDIDEQQEYFWHDSLGAHVLSDTDEVTGNRYRTDLKGAGQEIFELDSESGTEKSVAKFGADGARIGEEDASHVTIDYNALKLTDKDGNIYLHVSDLREKHISGGQKVYYAEITQTFLGDGSAKTFTLSMTVLNVISATDSSDSTNTGTYIGRNVVEFTNAPAAGATVTIIYRTQSEYAKAYTFGMRGSGNVGAGSFASGYQTKAAGNYSHAEGYQTKANGDSSHAECHASEASGFASHAEGNSTASDMYSHAEGFLSTAGGIVSHSEGNNTKATGSYSHSEGYYTEASGFASHAEGNGKARGQYSHAEGSGTASGMASHAQNIGTVAGYNGQTAIGTYNDNKEGNLLEVGNGTETTPSNAFEVTSDGNQKIALNTSAGSSTTDGALYAAIVALGWQSEVIE